MSETVVRKDLEQKQITFERVFNAPREKVFKAFTDPEIIAQWWGPRGWTTTVKTMEVKPGGVWHYGMRDTQGQEAWGKSVYKEIVKPERIVYIDTFTDEAGTHNPNMPELHVELEFIDEDGKTKVVSRTTFATAEQLQQVVDMGMEQGFKETWDRLAEYLAR